MTCDSPRKSDFETQIRWPHRVFKLVNWVMMPDEGHLDGSITGLQANTLQMIVAHCLLGNLLAILPVQMDGQSSRLLKPSFLKSSSP